MSKIFLFITGLFFTVIINAQVPKTVIVTACTLFTTLTTEVLGTITNLTLNGTIDARDFKTMRDVMPKLSVIDMNTATVLAYSGTEGMEGASSLEYPAD